MLLHNINDNALNACTHYLGAYQYGVKTRELYKEVNIYFRFGTKQKTRTEKLNIPLYL